MPILNLHDEASGDALGGRLATTDMGYQRSRKAGYGVLTKLSMARQGRDTAACSR
jgi:hypothetical protein